MKGGCLQTPSTSIIGTLLSQVGEFFTQMITWMGQLIDFYEQQPILLVFVILMIASIVLRLLRRWIPGRS